MNYWTQSKNNIYVAAHRGWCSKYPENTMSAFKAALDIGVDQIETDVRITKDGHLVLIHDNTVDRTTNGKGFVHDMTLSELRELDAGNGEKIPTLKELMELVKDHPTVTLDIELKESTISCHFDDASTITVLGRNKLNIYHGGKIYQLKGDERFCALKYVHIYNRYKNIQKGDENDKFLGL